MDPNVIDLNVVAPSKRPKPLNTRKFQSLDGNGAENSKKRLDDFVYKGPCIAITDVANQTELRTAAGQTVRQALGELRSLGL